MKQVSLLQGAGVEYVSHYTPLHYLPFIARSGELCSKPALKHAGFPDSHFRSKSKRHDVARGFGQYAFLTLDDSPRIVRAKLAGGFPHVALLVPASAIDGTPFELCRFNIAMTRRIRRNGTTGWSESETNGRYYDTNEVPVARTDADKTAMLEAHLGTTMIEVLVPDRLVLPSDTKVACYSEGDKAIAKSILNKIGRTWQVAKLDPPGPYPRRQKYVSAVEGFINTALTNKNWRGNGLEFDRV